MRNPTADQSRYKHIESKTNWGEDDSRHVISFRMQWYPDERYFSDLEVDDFSNYAIAWCEETFGPKYTPNNPSGRWYHSRDRLGFYFREKQQAMLFKVAMCA